MVAGLPATTDVRAFDFASTTYSLGAGWDNIDVRAASNDVSFDALGVSWSGYLEDPRLRRSQRRRFRGSSRGGLVERHDQRTDLASRSYQLRASS